MNKNKMHFVQGDEAENFEKNNLKIFVKLAPKPLILGVVFFVACLIVVVLLACDVI